jgi:hypothetical protein
MKFGLHCSKTISFLGKVGGGAANVQRRCCKCFVALLLYYIFCASMSPARAPASLRRGRGGAANVQRWCCKYFVALLLYYIICASMSPARLRRGLRRVSGEVGEVLQMFNGSVVNVSWLCFFTTLFVLQCLQRGLRRSLQRDPRVFFFF